MKEREHLSWGEVGGRLGVTRARFNGAIGS